MGIGFFSTLLAGLFFAGIGLVGLFTGRVLTNGAVGTAFFVRQSSPVAYWFQVAVWLAGGLFLLALAFYHAARV
jgi:hypothetical protein